MISGANQVKFGLSCAVVLLTRGKNPREPGTGAPSQLLVNLTQAKDTKPAAAQVTEVSVAGLLWPYTKVETSSHRVSETKDDGISVLNMFHIWPRTSAYPEIILRTGSLNKNKVCWVNILHNAPAGRIHSLPFHGQGNQKAQNLILLILRPRIT